MLDLRVVDHSRCSENLEGRIASLRISKRADPPSVTIQAVKTLETAIEWIYQCFFNPLRSLCVRN